MKGQRDATLDEQMAECRELLADVRGVTKDLRSAIRDAKEAFLVLAAEEMEKAAKAEIDKMAATTKDATQAATDAIMKRMDALTNLLMTGTKTGKVRPGGKNLEQYIEALVSQHGGPLYFRAADRGAAGDPDAHR